MKINTVLLLFIYYWQMNYNGLKYQIQSHIDFGFTSNLYGHSESGLSLSEPCRQYADDIDVI